MHSNATFSSHTFGGPEKGLTLAVVTVYFPTSPANRLILNSSPFRSDFADDPVSFYLSSFLGPQGPNGEYVSPVTTLVFGPPPWHRLRPARLAIASAALATELPALRPSQVFTWPPQSESEQFGVQQHRLFSLRSRRRLIVSAFVRTGETVSERW